MSGPDRGKPKAQEEGVEARVADWHLAQFQRRCAPPGLRPGSGAARGDCYARLSSTPCIVSRLRRTRPGRISSRLRRCSRDRIDQFRGVVDGSENRHLTGPSLCSAGSALKTRARAVLRPRLPPASALPVNELAPDRDRSGAAGAGVDNGTPSNGDDHRQIWPLRSPRRGQGAGRAGGEGGGGATDQRLPDMLLYHGQRRAPGAELGSRHGDQRRVESCSGLIGEPGGAGRAWRGAGRAGVWRPGRRAPHAPCTR